jgi:two-component system phosphate regulon sensor histidine kinase PhoR
MSKEVLGKIFERFYREPTGNLHDVKGFGLGLTYVKTMLDALGGSIAVKSDVAKGSTFEIYLPQNG